MHDNVATAETLEDLYQENGRIEMNGDTSTSHGRYSAPYETTVAFEKLKRRQVERDAVALRNRLRQLEREAEKVDKKIVRTKQRAKEIIYQRERNEHRESDRQKYLEELQEQVERHKEEIARVKDESRRNKLENEARLFREKLAVVEETKLERLEIERMVMENRLLDRRNAIERKEEVKKAALQFGTVKAMEADRKAQMAIENYTAKIEQEILARQEKERDLQQMADLELDLIERLKERQHEQQQAYLQLEAALNLGKSLQKRSARTQAERDDATCESPDLQVEQLFRELAAAAPPGTPAHHIATDQLQALLAAINVPLDSQQLAQSIAQLDPSGQGSIPMLEFITWLNG